MVTCHVLRLFNVVSHKELIRLTLTSYASSVSYFPTVTVTRLSGFGCCERVAATRPVMGARVHATSNWC